MPTNFFELFNLPICFYPDVSTVKKQYYKLSRLYHPDQNKASFSGSDYFLDKSSELNKAYTTLTNEDDLIGYVLMLKGLLSLDQKEELPMDFMMEVMEWNELLMELKINYDKDRFLELCNTIEEVEKENKSYMHAHMKVFDNEPTNEKVLENIKDAYLKNKYILRIKENLTTFASA